MCRALWLLVVGSSDEACTVVRRAAGVEAQVVAMTSDAAEAATLAGSSHADAVVLDARIPEAAQVAAAIRIGAPQIAILWVGEGPPPDADHAIGWGAQLADQLPGAITRALIARRSR